MSLLNLFRASQVHVEALDGYVVQARLRKPALVDAVREEALQRPSLNLVKSVRRVILQHFLCQDLPPQVRGVPWPLKRVICYWLVLLLLLSPPAIRFKQAGMRIGGIGPSVLLLLEGCLITWRSDGLRRIKSVGLRRWHAPLTSMRTLGVERCFLFEECKVQGLGCLVRSSPLPSRSSACVEP